VSSSWIQAPRPRWLRWRLPIVAFVVPLVMSTATVAQANQGGRVRSSATEDQGSRASITGSASLPSGSGVIATVRVQAVFAIALFQVGHIKQVGFTSNCGTNNDGFMVERKATGGPYICNFVSGTFGSDHAFAAQHDQSGWQAKKDGDPIGGGPFTLNFAAGRAFAVGEYSDGGLPPNGYNMTFGNGTKWGWKDGQGNWTVIEFSATFNQGGWNIGSLPSPFGISR
jgi:hypothetical protein